ncbi:MAG TPA: DUF2721 domain-containing protein [Anaerolineae bacterium]
MLSVAAVSQLIQFIIAPVVMISTCGLILNGIVQQYSAVDERLRGMMRERMTLLDKAVTTRFDEDRLVQIGAQVPIIRQRHKKLHQAIMLLYIAIVILVSSMFVIAVATLLDNAYFSSAALALFMAGTAVILIAVLVTIFEVRQSLRALYYEVDRVISLQNQDESGPAAPKS